MWILFKEEYKRDNEMINPSEEFLEKLKADMKKEEAKKERFILFDIRKMAVVAAVVAVSVIGADSYNKFYKEVKNNIIQQTEISDNSGSEEKNGITEKDGSAGNSGSFDNNGSDEKSGSAQDDLFSNSSWYDSGMSSEEIYKTFVKRISSQDDLKQLSVSDTNDFTHARVMDKASVNRLAGSLKGGSLIKDGSDLKENPKYYMASFNNGDIIKFVIYDNRYFECSEFDGTYSLDS